jgi:exosome complex component RRP45
MRNLFSLCQHHELKKRRVHGNLAGELAALSAFGHYAYARARSERHASEPLIFFHLHDCQGTKVCRDVKMPREADISTNERAFVLAAIREEVRVDGRALDEYRPIDLAFGDEYGVADVRIGKTRVLVRISAEVVVPYADRKFDGIFTIASELSPIASPAFEVGR